MMVVMGADLSELSSIASTLGQLEKRVAGMAEAALREGEETVAADLVAVERALAGAARRLSRLRER
jgi:Tfp pilus assembly protein PilX